MLPQSEGKNQCHFNYIKFNSFHWLILNSVQFKQMQKSEF